MPTQFDAWRRAWKSLPDEVHLGPLSREGAPTRKVRQNLFPTIFTELTVEQRDPRRSSRELEEGQARQIINAVSRRREQLVDISRAATSLVDWFRRTPEVQRLAGAANVADLWAPRLRDLLAATDSLAEWGPERIAGWLNDYYHLGACDPALAAPDAVTIRAYLAHPEVASRTAADLTEQWTDRPGPFIGDTPNLESLGLWMRGLPGVPQRQQLADLAADVLGNWPHDDLARRLGLSGARAGDEIPIPSVRRHETESPRDDGPPVSALSGVDQNAEPRTPPLRRSLESRLVDFNIRGRGSDSRTGLTVSQLVSEEIVRVCSPLGLLDHQNRAAFIAASCTVDYPLWVDSMKDLPPLHPEVDMATLSPEEQRVARQETIIDAIRQVRLTLYSHDLTFESLPPAARDRLNDPAATFGPRLWSRLHNRERDGRALADPYEAVRSAWIGWLKDLPRECGRSSQLRDDDEIEAKGGSTENELYSHPVAIALAQLSNLLGKDVVAFCQEATAGRVAAELWTDLTRRGDEEIAMVAANSSPRSSTWDGPVPWPPFGSVVEYLQSVRAER